MISRCSVRRVFIHTADGAVSVSDSAAAALRSAIFNPNHSARCKCSEGECSKAACDELRIYDEQGKRCATFHGGDWQAVDDTLGNLKGLVVYRAPASAHATQDANSPLIFPSRSEELATLRRINEANQDLWRPQN